MNPIAVRIDRKIPEVFSQVRPGATFLSIKGYTNNFGEVSDYGVVFHFDYMNAVQSALNTWRGLGRMPFAIQEKARHSLIRSYSDTLKYGFNHRARSANAYCKLIDANGATINGVKFHVRDRVVHLVGLLVSKRVVSPGDYSDVTESGLTRERNTLIAMTPLSRFRQFKLVDGRFKTISVDSLRLTDSDLKVPA